MNRGSPGLIRYFHRNSFHFYKDLSFAGLGVISFLSARRISEGFAQIIPWQDFIHSKSLILRAKIVTYPNDCSQNLLYEKSFRYLSSQRKKGYFRVS